MKADGASLQPREMGGRSFEDLQVSDRDRHYEA